MPPETAVEPLLVGYRLESAHFADSVCTCSRNVTSQTYGPILARQFCFVQSRRTRGAKIAVCGAGSFRLGGAAKPPRGRCVAVRSNVLQHTRCGVGPTRKKALVRGPHV